MHEQAHTHTTHPQLHAGGCALRPAMYALDSAHHAVMHPSSAQDAFELAKQRKQAQPAHYSHHSPAHSLSPRSPGPRASFDLAGRGSPVAARTSFDLTGRPPGRRESAAADAADLAAARRMKQHLLAIQVAQSGGRRGAPSSADAAASRGNATARAAVPAAGTGARPITYLAPTFGFGGGGGGDDDGYMNATEDGEMQDGPTNADGINITYAVVGDAPRGGGGGGDGYLPAGAPLTMQHVRGKGKEPALSPAAPSGPCGRVFTIAAAAAVGRRKEMLAAFPDGVEALEDADYEGGCDAASAAGSEYHEVPPSFFTGGSGSAASQGAQLDTRANSQFELRARGPSPGAAVDEHRRRASPQYAKDSTLPGVGRPPTPPMRRRYTQEGFNFNSTTLDKDAHMDSGVGSNASSVSSSGSAVSAQSGAGGTVLALTPEHPGGSYDNVQVLLPTSTVCWPTTTPTPTDAEAPAATITAATAAATAAVMAGRSSVAEDTRPALAEGRQLAHGHAAEDPYCSLPHTALLHAKTKRGGGGGGSHVESADKEAGGGGGGALEEYGILSHADAGAQAGPQGEARGGRVVTLALGSRGSGDVTATDTVGITSYEDELEVDTGPRSHRRGEDEGEDTYGKLSHTAYHRHKAAASTPAPGTLTHTVTATAPSAAAPHQHRQQAFAVPVVHTHDGYVNVGKDANA